MKIGAYASFMSPVSTPETIADLGRRMEDGGLDSLWMGEHIVLFDEMEFPYPGSPDGRCNEQLDLMIKLWTEPVTTHEGRHFQVQACRMDPKPVQKPHVSLYVGGYSKPAIRRAVKYGRGWLGFGINAEMTGAFVSTLEQALHDAGRGRDDFEIIVSPATVSDDEVRAFRDLGVDRLVPVLSPKDSNAESPRLKELAKYANMLAGA